MAATNYTPIQLYYSTTASAAPIAGNLTSGELAINITDGKLYYKDNAGVVQVIATKGAGTIGGSNTQIQYNNNGALAGNAAMTFNSGTNTVTLTTLNLTNALGAIYGGTAQSSYTQGDILYSSATNTLSKLGIGTVNYILTSTGSVPQWSAPSSITVQTATNLAGGAAGSVPYQSAPDTTTFLSIGAANRVMTSSGSAPQWVTALTGLTGVSSSSITNTSLTATRLVYSSTAGLQTDSANLTFDGTTLSATGYSTTGLSTLVKTVTIGNSNFNGTAVFAAATPAKLYVGTGTVTDTTSAIGATNATGAISSLAITPIAATNTSVTYTNASTLYIAGAPSAGTNVTITNPYSLYVSGGTSYFGGAVNFAVTPIYSGGTANGVMYLNGSKEITTGTALSFDASTLLINAANTSYRGQLSLQGGASDFAQITFYRGATSDTNQVGYVHSLNTAGSNQSMVIGARNGAFLKFDVSDAERARITPTYGNLLVGTSTEVSDANLKIQLNVTATDTQRFFGVNNNGSYGLIMGFTYNDQGNIRTVGSYPLTFGTNNLERGRFDTSGNLLVNTTNNYSVGATGYVMAKTGYVLATDNTGSASNRNWLINANGSAAGSLDFVDSSSNTGWPNNAYRLSITNAGVVLIGGVATVASGFSGLAQLEVSGSNGGIIINSSSTGASDYSRLVFTKLNSSGNEGLIRYNTNDYHMAFWTSATEVGRFTGSGYFLIGTTTARNRLTVQGTVYSTPTLGTASGQAFFGEAAGYGTMIGTSGFGYGWIQQQRVDGTATAYPLILQPVGGQVYVNRTGAQNNGKLEVLADSGAQAIVAQVQSDGNSLFQGFAAAGGSAVFQVTGGGVLTTNTIVLNQGQITFPATQVSSSNANTLDDYEEGTWTPVFRGSGTAGSYTLTIDSNGATYTKIGRVVTLNCSFVVTTIVSAGSGYAQITGLPFANVGQASGSSYFANVTVDAATLWCDVEFISANSQTIVYFNSVRNGTSSLDTAISGFAQGCSVRFSLTYTTST